MSPAQRQSLFDRYFPSLAREYAQAMNLEYAGTIRKLPPPPLPGEIIGQTRYYINTLTGAGKGTRLVEFPAEIYAVLRRAEAWVDTGKGAPPSLDSIRRLVARHASVKKR